MIEVGLQYLGKKAPFTLSPAYMETPVQIHKVKDFVFWVPKKVADRLISDNPRMFRKMGERGDDEVIIEKEIPKDPFAEMTKRQIQGYARENFGVELDMAKKRDELIEDVKDLEAQVDAVVFEPEDEEKEED